MSSGPDMWLAFARTFGMLFVVLALFLLAFYLFRKLSGNVGAKGAGLIQILAVHHISPKEKLMLVRVLNETIFIGVTQQTITSLAVLGEEGPELVSGEAAGIKPVSSGFSELLKRTLGASGVNPSPGAEKGGNMSGGRQ